MATYANGSTRDVTSESTIQRYSVPHSGEDVLQVAPDGVVTGGTAGEMDLEAYYPRVISTPEGSVIRPGTLSSSKLRVLVLQPGTFRVSGLVIESGLPFPSVQVAVISGTRAGLRVATDNEGKYSLYGLAGPTDLTALEEGFQTATRSIIVNDHQTIDFNLQPLVGYDSVSGDWRLTVQASPTCELPREATTRTFHARLTQRGSQLSVDLESPTRIIVEGYPSQAFGGVSGDAVGFYLQRDPDDRSPPRWVLLDRLEPGRFLGISGPSEGRRDGNSITGTLSGYFSVYRTAGPNYLAPGTILESSCLRKKEIDSSLHTFRLDRQ